MKALLFAAAILAAAGPAWAQHEHHAAELGEVAFATSCRAEAQGTFNRAIAWLHSFEYEEAEKSFLEAAGADPKCAMAQWGVAMSHYHPLWAPPGPAELEKGAAAVARAQALGAPTARERDYVAAMAAFYRDAATVGHGPRVLAYVDAMRELHRRHPDDQEGAVFYALALIAAGTMDNDESFAREKEAAGLLNAVLARQPRHPGVSHYLIHSYDYPPLAHLALPAARSYAGIAPASAHAQHMPSHIFSRLGLWKEAIASDLKAEAAAKAHAARNKMPGAWDEQLHAMDYLAYAYLQLGEDAKARGVMDELNAIERVDPPNFKVAYSMAAIPARYALERRQWAEAAALALPPTSVAAVPWARFRWAQAHIHFARAVGAARSGKVELAREEVGRLAEIVQALPAKPGEYDWGKQVDIERQIAAAWLSKAEGRGDEAVGLMRAAADLDDATEKHPVTPGQILPAREQLGELLLELNRPAEALAEFEASLTRAPGRFGGLSGAARAADLAKESAKAARYREMAPACGPACPRPAV